MGSDGRLKNLTLACSRSGKYQIQAKKFVTSSTVIKNRMKGKDKWHNISDGKFILTFVVLEHNHSLSPGKARFCKSNKKWILMSRGE